LGSALRGGGAARAAGDDAKKPAAPSLGASPRRKASVGSVVLPRAVDGGARRTGAAGAGAELGGASGRAA
jgi:hypothetical protein